MQWVHLVFLTTDVSALFGGAIRCRGFMLLRAPNSVVPGFVGGTTETYVSHILNDLVWSYGDRTGISFVKLRCLLKAPGGSRAIEFAPFYILPGTSVVEQLWNAFNFLTDLLPICWWSIKKTLSRWYHVWTMVSHGVHPSSVRRPMDLKARFIHENGSCQEKLSSVSASRVGQHESGEQSIVISLCQKLTLNRCVIK